MWFFIAKNDSIVITKVHIWCNFQLLYERRVSIVYFQSKNLSKEKIYLNSQVKNIQDNFEMIVGKFRKYECLTMFPLANKSWLRDCKL